uniref:Uncharacterized protein n=1 Tax=Acrobeloides nanus TaxID=290746 RepID=A0A914CXF3_9BILA
MKFDKTNTKAEKYHVFLFEATIMICKPKDNGYMFLNEYELKYFDLSVCNETNSWWLPSSTYHWALTNPSNGWILNFVFKSRKKSERIYKIFKEEAMRINKPESHELLGHKPRTNTTFKPFVCSGCDKLFDILKYECES